MEQKLSTLEVYFLMEMIFILSSEIVTPVGKSVYHIF